MFAPRVSKQGRTRTQFIRFLSTLKQNPHLYVHPNSETSTYAFSLLPTAPRSSKVAVGFSTSNPPTTQTFRENREFNKVLHSVIRANCKSDPSVRAQAAAFASPGGLGLGGAGFAQTTSKVQKAEKGGGDGGGGASAQGGAGGAGIGGWCHISDLRNPPDFGRIAFPEDIFGSVEVNGNGEIDGDGHYQESGTYRTCTNEGILGLTPYMREKLVERLRQIESQEAKP